MKNIYLLVLCFCYLSGYPQTSPIEIKFDPEDMETTDLGLSDFVESIEYIPLETKDECLIGQGMNFDFDETHIIVKFNGNNPVYLFDRKGRFIRTIGSIGEGPGEFLYVKNLFLDPLNNYIVIESLGKAQYYNKQGEYLWSTPLPVNDRLAVSYFQEQFLCMAESYIFQDSTYNVYTIYNQKGNVVKEAIPSTPIPLKRNSGWRISYKCKEIISAYTYQNRPHVREYLNDTVYVVNGLNQFIPKYILNLGKYKVTPDIQADLDHFEDRIYNRVFIQDIIEMSERLLIQYFYKGNIHSCFYDKKKRKLYKFNSHGYPNDYDGGIDYIITGSLMGQKNRYARTALDATDFISSVEQVKNEKRIIKGPKSAVQAFKKLAKKVDPEDNPVIMIMKLK